MDELIQSNSRDPRLFCGEGEIQWVGFAATYDNVKPVPREAKEKRRTLGLDVLPITEK